jgi:hypothetical protein
MTLKHISFNDSVVMRELERLEAKKNPELIKKTASISDEAFETTNAFHNILDLVCTLRNLGKITEANSLQEKVSLYKNAETHLYKAIDEDGKNLLDFAHPEGDVEIFPASDGLGKIETQHSQHKRIVDIIQKKTKIASAKEKLLEKVAQDLGLVKNSQESMVTKLKEAVSDLIIVLDKIGAEKPQYSISGTSIYLKIGGWTTTVDRFSTKVLSGLEKVGDDVIEIDNAQAYGVFNMFAGEGNVYQAKRTYNNKLVRGETEDAFSQSFANCVNIANNSIRKVYSNIREQLQQDHTLPTLAATSLHVIL